MGGAFTTSRIKLPTPPVWKSFMDTKHFTTFLKTIRDHADHDAGIGASIQAAYSAMGFNPSKSRAKSRALRDMRKAQGASAKQHPSADFVWHEFQPWAASDYSSILIIEGSLSARERAEDIALETTDLIESAKIPLAWVLNWHWRSSDEGLVREACNGSDLVAQLCLQLLLQNPKLHNRNAIDHCLQVIGWAAAASGWFEVLAHFVEGLDQVCVVVDLAVLGAGYVEALTWPSLFRGMFRSLDTKGTRSMIKCLLFTSRPVATLDMDAKNTRVVRFPQNSLSTRPRSGADTPTNASADQNKSWLQCLRRRKPKHVQVQSDSDADESRAMEVKRSVATYALAPLCEKSWPNRRRPVDDEYSLPYGPSTCYGSLSPA